jgi:hypothetical protein
MLNRWSNLEKAILTNVGIGVHFVCSLSFQNNPIHMWHGSLFEQLPNTQKIGFTFFNTHTNQKQKE